MALAQAILALLYDCPCSGYDLAKQFDSSVGFFWKASHQQIYRELSKIEALCWVSYETIAQTGKPDKKLYRVTEVGKEELTDWLNQQCEPIPVKDELLVKIFVGYLAAPQTLQTELQRHRQLHQQKLQAYKQLEEQYFADPPALSLDAKFRYLTLIRGIHEENSWLNWCDEAIELLKVDDRIQ